MAPDNDIIVRPCSTVIRDCRICIDKLNKYLFCCVDTFVRLYDVTTGECIGELSHTSPLVAAHLNPNNFLQLLTCTAFGEISLWNYEEGTKLKSWHVRKHVAGYFTFKKADCLGVAIVPIKDQGYRAEQILLNDEFVELELLAENVSNKFNGVSCDPQGQYFAFMNGPNLRVHSLNDDKKILHTSRKTLECVVCHPTKNCIATGDVDGQVVLWYNFFDNTPVKTVFHWHSERVRDIAFPSDGSSMYTGGLECVVAKWTLQSSQKQDTKEFLSRLDGPIVSLTSSPDNQLLIVVLEDNSIRIVSSQMKMKSSIRHYSRSWWFLSVFRNLRNSPAGLRFDSEGFIPRLTKGCLISNGIPGRLQFYNPQTDHVAYSHDVVNRNLPPFEAKNCTDVEHFDFWNRWLVTVEYRSDNNYTNDFALKFWFYDEQTEKLELSAAIENPHFDVITSIKFRPVLDADRQNVEPIVVTTSRDCTVKVWALTETKDYNGNKKLSWLCDGSLCYRRKPAHYCQFSKNGKVLCIAFGGTLTLWNFEDRSLLVTLPIKNNDEVIKQLEFGQVKKESKLICVLFNSGECSVWDIDSQVQLWTMNVKISTLCVDPYSGMFAAFSNDSVHYFKPSNENPIAVCNFKGSKVVGACFASNNSQTLNPECPIPVLYFLCTDQIVRRICTKGQHVELSNRQKLKAQSDHAGNQTALAAVLENAKVESSDKPLKSAVDTRYVDARSNIQGPETGMLNAPSHTLPNIQSLGLNFIRTCLQPKVKNEFEPKSSTFVKKPGDKELFDDNKKSNGAALGIAQSINENLTRRDLSFLDSCFKKL